MTIDAELSIVNNPSIELKGEAWIEGEEMPGGVFNPWNSGEYIALLDGGSFWSGGDSFDGGQILAQIMAIDMVIVN